jgi:hypothetical protein
MFLMKGEGGGVEARDIALSSDDQVCVGGLCSWEEKRTFVRIGGKIR